MLFSVLVLSIVENVGLLAVDEVLELLKNGEWHGLSELADRSGLGARKTGLVVRLLCEFGFLVCDEKGKRVKLSGSLLEFLRRVEGLEHEERGVKKLSVRGVSVFLRVFGFSFRGA